MRWRTISLNGVVEIILVLCHSVNVLVLRGQNVVARVEEEITTCVTC